MTLRETIGFATLCIGLIVISFCLELGAYPILRDTIVDYRTSKEFLSLLFAGAIFLWGISSDQKIKCINPWLVGLVGYILIHPFLSPLYTVKLFRGNIGGFWEFKPMVYAFIYFGLFCTVSNWKLREEHFNAFFKVVMWIGFISSLYIFLQALHLDQFQYWYETGKARSVTNGNLTATFTQPNYSASFIAIAIPFALYFRRWVIAAIMAAAVFLINSKMAILALILIAYFLLYKYRREFFFWFIGLSFLIGFLVWKHHPLEWSDSGRFGLWKQMIHDIIYPTLSEKTFPIFGDGLGYYGQVWYAIYPWAMEQAHNEWLQFFMDAGLVGVALLFFSIFWLLKRLNLHTIKDNQTLALAACFLGILSCSAGLFIWQIEPHRILSVVVFALLHNKLMNKGEESR